MQSFNNSDRECKSQESGSRKANTSPRRLQVTAKFFSLFIPLLRACAMYSNIHTKRRSDLWKLRSLEKKVEKRVLGTSF